MVTNQENLKESLTELPEAPESLKEGQMRADLERSFEDLKNKGRALETEKYINQNKIRELKLSVIRQLFAALEDMGIDPNDLGSINKFLQGLEQQDPDLAELFRIAFEGLVPEEGGEVPSTTGEMPMATGATNIPEQTPNLMNNLMNKFSNLQEQVLRQ